MLCRMDLQRALFGVLYRIGRTPWVGHPAPLSLQALVEGPQALPAGRALDIGCGTGDMSIYLAARGWDVTGVDFVNVALRKARAAAARASASPRFLWADVKALRESLEPGATFGLLFDGGCFHGLPSQDREAWAREVTALAEPGATLVLCAFDTGHAPNGRLGTTRAEVEQRMRPAWELVREAVDPTVSSVREHLRVYELRRVTA